MSVVIWFAAAVAVEVALAVFVGRCIAVGMGTLPLTPDPHPLSSAKHAARDRDF